MSRAARDLLAASGPWTCVHGGAARTIPPLPALADLLAWHVCHPSNHGDARGATLLASHVGTVPWKRTQDPALGTRLSLDLDACDEIYGHMADHAAWLDARRVVEAIDVQATTLDAWAEQAGVRDVLLLSLSLEGGELDALRGADGLLRTGRITVVRTAVALRPVYHDQPVYADVDAWLASRGYGLVDCRFPWDHPRRVDPAVAGGQPARWSIEGVATYAHGSLLAGEAGQLPRAVAAAAVLAQAGYGSTAATVLDRQAGWDRRQTDAWLVDWARPGRRERWRAWWRSRLARR
ncbi:hypothetical protein TBR22_A09560 [Luteitalea sp. TBR-22]|uniref:FkbM family methyltransferase n=1 Tax=Luteitalea sp. TBR-22 TaxID=2802971 RepID=UPI001AFC8E49|nr:FkbM family methyltransferase [Luteitalea sp. TBR-22]BCS31752.1 hypothetical protein TBR22_A09560 [Luteitalea sp. TBR-22]